MPRRLSLVLVAILVSVATIFASSALVHAQDATPAADTEETTLKPGDSFVFPPIAGEWRNDGQDMVVFTVVLIDPVGAATPAPQVPEATPAA